jgi:hypothetical protein
VLVEAPAVVGGDVSLERGAVLGRPHPHPQVRGDAPRGLDRAEAPKGVADPQRVVDELAVVVDAARPGPEQELVVVEDLVPQGLDPVDLGEEPVAPDVEPVAVADDGAADAADRVVGLEDGAGDAGLGELVGGGQAGGAGADDHHPAGGRGRGVTHGLSPPAEASRHGTSAYGGGPAGGRPRRAERQTDAV